MRKIVNYRALPIFLIFLVLGVLVATFLTPIFGILFLSLCGLGIVICFFLPRLRKFLLRSIMIACAVILALLATNFDIYFHKTYQSVDLDKVVISGRVDALSEFDENGVITDKTYVVLNNVNYMTEDGKTTKLLIRIKVKGFKNEVLKLGDKVTITGSISDIEFDPTSQYSIYNYRNDILKESEILTVENIERMKPNFFDGIKLKSKMLLTKNTYSDNGVDGFIYSMLFGSKDGLNDSIKGNFAQTGLSHLFAVSGLHVGMIGLVILAILKKAKVKIWLQTIILSVFLGGYCVLCGFSPSVVRASLMMLIALVARALGYRNDSISTLSFACIAVLIFRPFYLFDLSFIMTVFAVLGIVLLNKPIYNKMRFAPDYVAKPLSLMLAVNISLFPVMISYFGTVSLLFIVANMIIIPIVTLAYPLIFVAICVSLLLPFLGFLITPMTYLFELVLLIANAIALIPFISIEIEALAAIIVIWLAVIVFLSDYIVVGYKFKRIMATGLILAFTFILIAGWFGIGYNKTEISNVYYDKFSEDNYYHIEHNNDDYLILNGEIDEYALEAAVLYNKYNHVNGFEVVVKPELDRLDIELLRDYSKRLGIRRVVTGEVEHNFNNVWLTNYATYESRKGIEIFFGVEGETIAVVEEVAVLFSNNTVIADRNLGFRYDIIFTNYNINSALEYNPKHIVNNYPEKLTSFNDNVLSNDFTFKLNSGKIKVRSK